jgi:Zn-dependent protease with chaperone function
MDFFAHQDAARKQTGRLVMLFGLSLVGIIAALYIVALIVVGATDTSRASLDSIDNAYSGTFEDVGLPVRTPGWFRPDILAIVSVGVLGIVGLASLAKMAQLRGGGHVVAAQLGGTHITHDTADPLERRVLNVVEEMAIASGIPAPPVFVLRNEPGINAFAAGWGPADAAIGVTRGCLETLDRDELQGVMAHEFAHILNGDMRLNIRLMGIIFGILAIHVIGRTLLRFGIISGARVRSSREGNSGSALVFIGLALAAIGGIGAFFGSLIRASVSRQREFLADASAVQFTRNPDGIAGALKKIAGLSEGSRVRTPVAEEASHMFFGSAMLSGIAGLFATHPPLPIRIRRIEPNWDGKVPRIDAPRSTQIGASPAQGAAAFAPGVAGPPTRQSPRPTGRPATNASAVEWIGRLGGAHVERSRQILAPIPPELLDAARDAYSARAVVLAMLLDRDPGVHAKQVERIVGTNDRGLLAETARLDPLAKALAPEARVPIAEIAVGALSALTPDQCRAFRAVLGGLVEADARRNVLEWMLERLVDAALEARFSGHHRAMPEYYGLQRLGAECSMTLSMLAHAGSRDAEAAQRAFSAGVSVLGADVAVAFVPAPSCSLTALGHALVRLATTAPAIKKQIVIACARVVAADGRAEITEVELLRGVCAALGAPMPPVLPGQRLVA